MHILGDCQARKEHADKGMHVQQALQLAVSALSCSASYH